MLKSKINEYLHWLIVEWILKGLSCKRITRQLNISKSSISRIFLHFKRYGCVEDLLLLGLRRIRVLATDNIKYLKSLLKKKVDWYL